MLEQPFPLINDTSSDTGLKKMNTFCLYISDVSRNTRVECKFYDMCVITGEGCLKPDLLFQAWDQLGKCCKYWLGQYKGQYWQQQFNQNTYPWKNKKCFIADCNQWGMWKILKAHRFLLCFPWRLE